jgi:2,3-bisphosphoglycerate-dependent phosphoglycerate mutase
MQFYFIRHGQSENNLLYLTTGGSDGRSDDPELTDVGCKQAKTLAQFLVRAAPPPPANLFDEQNLAGFGITHLYTSLMVRAVATGAMVASALNLPLLAWQDLHETGGIYHQNEQTGERTGRPGKNRAYFEEHFPGLRLPDSLGKAGWWDRPFEEREQRPARAERVIRELLDRHGGKEDHVAVISHGGFYNVLLRSIFKIEREDCWFGLNNAAITRIDYSADGVALTYMNRADFLPKEWVT